MHVHKRHNTRTYRSEGVKPGTEEEAELDGIEQVGLAGTIPTDDRVRGRRKWVDLRLLPERTKVRYCYSGGRGEGGSKIHVNNRHLDEIFGGEGMGSTNQLDRTPTGPRNHRITSPQCRHERYLLFDMHGATD